MNTSSIHPHRNLFLREIEEAFQVLQGLEKDGFYNVPKITWWILKYEELYDYSYNHRHINSCFEGMGCCCTDKNPEMKFSSLYSSLKEVIDLHSHEKYFKEELSVFEKIRNDHPALMQWLKKNETLGSWDFLLFWLEWLEEKDVVNPFITDWPDEFRFKAEEWKNTIKFCEVFNEIYWKSDACPDYRS